MLENISWLGHASILIATSENKKVYIDPYDLSIKLKADFIFITHKHYDHFSIDDIDSIYKDDTIIIAPENIADDIPDKNVVKVVPNVSYTIDNIKFETFPAYNIYKQYHPKTKGWVGYNIMIDDKKYYIAGDTDLIPEMNNIETDIAFLPIGGTFTMGISDAVEAYNKINSEYVIPIHYGTIVGDISDGEKFKNLIGNKCILLEHESKSDI